MATSQMGAMFDSLYRSIARQPADELARQHAVLDDVEGTRIFLTAFAYLISAIFIPLWLCALLGGSEAIAAMAGPRGLVGLDPARQPGRYLLVHLGIVVEEAAFSLAAMLVWQVEDPFSRATTVGMLSMTLLQLTAIRTVHLPFAITGWATMFSIATAGNAILWVQRDNWTGLGVSTLVLAAGAAFTLRALQAQQQLQAEMAVARRAAETADAAKSRFLALVSHELRTPLNAIMGMGQMEQELSLDPGSKGRMATLIQGAEDLSALVNDMLDITAAEEGRMVIRPATLVLRAEIERVLQLFRPVAAAKGLTIHVAWAPGLPERASFDGRRLSQALSNLLANAIRHCDSWLVRVDVQMIGPLLSIAVADTGPGIDPELAARLFQPFEQGATVTGGSGLGLYISRQIARAMGGDLVLENQAVGARFRLTMALEPAGALVETPGADAASPGRQARPAYPGRRVLVVDDIATNRLIAIGLLRLYGLQCAEARDARETLARLAEVDPCIVFLDMHMPEIDGHQVFQLITQAQKARGKAMPAIVAMTADAGYWNRQACLDAGLDDFLAKPLMLERIEEVLHRFLAEPLLARADGLPSCD